MKAYIRVVCAVPRHSLRVAVRTRNEPTSFSPPAKPLSLTLSLCRSVALALPPSLSLLLLLPLPLPLRPTLPLSSKTPLVLEERGAVPQATGLGGKSRLRDVTTGRRNSLSVPTRDTRFAPGIGYSSFKFERPGPAPPRSLRAGPRADSGPLRGSARASSIKRERQDRAGGGPARVILNTAKEHMEIIANRRIEVNLRSAAPSRRVALKGWVPMGWAS